ncbi:hypothetical protein L208DRAFT_1408053 [Tricholoma matsutake]|nr:hypothetical protein L208DRAFT_1408053 [Tricholoma matsutake 945]
MLQPVVESGPETRPTFPPELEREIFERTARSYRGTGVILALVCRRVQIWMESVIYESIILFDAVMCTRFLRAIDARPPSFFTANVKSLCIPGDIDPPDAERILVACQGVINLAYWITYRPPSFHTITSLRPKRLSINTRGLFGESPSADLGQPFFARVTHLEIVDWPWMPLSSNLALLPCLTHLAVDLDRFDDRIIRRLRDILDSCQLLLVLLCLVPDDDVMVLASSSLAELDDSRLVVLSDADALEDWETSLINYEACQWAFAEGIVNEKRN